MSSAAVYSSATPAARGCEDRPPLVIAVRPNPSRFYRVSGYHGRELTRVAENFTE